MTLEKRIIEGPVRITLDKLNAGRYILCALNPQWNMPSSSKFDYDSFSPVITNNIVVKDYYDSQI